MTIYRNEKPTVKLPHPLKAFTKLELLGQKASGEELLVKNRHLSDINVTDFLYIWNWCIQYLNLKLVYMCITIGLESLPRLVQL